MEIGDWFNVSLSGIDARAEAARVSGRALGWKSRRRGMFRTTYDMGSIRCERIR